MLGLTFCFYCLVQMYLVVNLATQDMLHPPFLSMESTNKKRRKEPRNLHKAKSRRQLPTTLNATCVRIECIRQEAISLARAFPERSNRTWPTWPGENNKMAEDPISETMHYGLLYSRIPKTGSSTITAAALRISHRYSVWLKGISHALPSEEGYGKRHPTKSFLFASVRDPAKRAISYISYDTSRESRVLTEAELLRCLQTFDTYGGVSKSEGRGGSQLAYASLNFIPKLSAWRHSFPTHVLNPQRVKENVHHILQDYDFLLVTERMDESLVAMALTLGISLEDVLVFNSKIGDTHFLPVHYKNGTVGCVALNRNQHSSNPSIQAYLNCDEWQVSLIRSFMRTCAVSSIFYFLISFVLFICLFSWFPMKHIFFHRHAMNYGDYLLHTAASISLDMTIRALGVDRFQQALGEFNSLMARAKKRCVPQQIHRPCSSSGKLQIEKASKDCYHADAGCGYPCIDKMLSEMSHRND
jgi:hypothetical protein